MVLVASIPALQAEGASSNLATYSNIFLCGERVSRVTVNHLLQVRILSEEPLKITEW